MIFITYFLLFPILKLSPGHFVVDELLKLEQSFWWLKKYKKNPVNNNSSLTEVKRQFQEVADVPN